MASVYIRAEAFADLLTCPVCLCQVQGATVTPCGHLYCKACIAECLNLMHKCPVCNKPTEKKSLVPDKTMDYIIKVYNDEKTVGEKKYFETLVKSGGDTAAQGSETPFSPVEQVLKEHLKNSLDTHQRYYESLKKELDQKLVELRADFAKAEAAIKAKAGPPAALAEELAELRAAGEARERQVTGEMKASAQMVAQAYDTYLKERLPDIATLPVRVSLCFPAKNVRIPEVVLKPTDTSEQVLQWVQAQLQSAGDDLVDATDAKVFCYGPFNKQPSMGDYVNAASEADLPPGARLVSRTAHILLHYSVKAGSELVVMGAVKCHSDLPKQCFAATFTQGDSVDFFSCQDCGFKWICRSCMEVCHKTHQTSAHIMNHKPTWACCYCPKKKKCSINSR